TQGRGPMTIRLKTGTCVAGLLSAMWMIGAASAADLPARMVTKAPVLPPPPPMYNWTGFYAGVNVGGSWGHQDTALVTAAGTALTNSLDVNGVVGGAQVGYNWQGYGSPWVFGVEADIQGSGQRDSGSFFIPG